MTRYRSGRGHPANPGSCALLSTSLIHHCPFLTRAPPDYLAYRPLLLTFITVMLLHGATAGTWSWTGWSATLPVAGNAVAEVYSSSGVLLASTETRQDVTTTPAWVAGNKVCAGVPGRIVTHASLNSFTSCVTCGRCWCPHLTESGWNHVRLRPVHKSYQVRVSHSP